jgi:hypothetical protein
MDDVRGSTTPGSADEAVTPEAGAASPASGPSRRRILAAGAALGAAATGEVGLTGTAKLEAALALSGGDKDKDKKPK